MRTGSWISWSKTLLAAAVLSVASFAITASADPVGGSIDHVDMVLVNRTDVYKPTLYYGEQTTEIRVVADGPVKLVVKDASGRVVAVDVGSVCVGFVNPDHAGFYTVEITNLDDTPTTYRLQEF